MQISKLEEQQFAHLEVQQVLKPRNDGAIDHIEIDDPDTPGKKGIINDRNNDDRI